ncbi:MAG: hypothetical protein AB1468_06050 [Candidatus Micrarchaeota archaeon]
MVFVFQIGTVKEPEKEEGKKIKVVMLLDFPLKKGKRMEEMLGRVYALNSEWKEEAKKLQIDVDRYRREEKNTKKEAELISRGIKIDWEFSKKIKDVIDAYTAPDIPKKEFLYDFVILGAIKGAGFSSELDVPVLPEPIRVLNRMAGTVFGAGYGMATGIALLASLDDEIAKEVYKILVNEGFIKVPKVKMK